MSDAMQNNATQNAEVKTQLNSPSAVLNPEDNKSDATPWIIFVVGCIATFLMASALLNIASAALAWAVTVFENPSLYPLYEEDVDFSDDDNFFIDEEYYFEDTSQSLPEDSSAGVLQTL